MQLVNISAGYRGIAKVRNVSLTFKRGSVTALVGPNGSGKSTLMKAACGLLPLMEGQVLLGGRAAGAYTRTQWAQQVSYFAQSRNIPAISVKAIVLHGRFPYMGYPRRYQKQDMEAAERAMEWVGISHLAGRSMAELSGGERQKAYVAMSIAQDGDFVFLDEPTTYLDIGHQLDMMDLVKRLKEKGKAVVMVLHDLGMALTHADCMAVLHKGELAAFSGADQVYASGVLQKIFGVEIRRDELEDRRVFCFARTKEKESWYG